MVVKDGQAYVGTKFTSVIHSYDLATGEPSGDIEVTSGTESVGQGPGNVIYAVSFEHQEVYRLDLG